MFVIAGLGNPGRKYENTRHNVGFCVIDRLADKYGISVNEKMFQALVGRGVIEGEKVLLVKPQTFMNLSGESIQPILGYYKVDPTMTFPWNRAISGSAARAAPADITVSRISSRAWEPRNFRG